jgi:hypothetical protein
MSIKIPRFYLDDAKRELAKLNNLLQEKCEDLSLTIDYYSDMIEKGITNISVYNKEHSKKYDTALLCLNYNNSCISSLVIELNPDFGDDDEIEIASKTNSKYEGRKFNKLLRAVIIIIGGFIKSSSGTPIDHIFSRAENPISAYLMINTFNALPLTEEGRLMIDFMKIRKNDGIVPLDTIKEYMDKPDGETKYKVIKTRVGINQEKDKEHVNRAMEVFQSVLNTKWFQSIDKQCGSLGDKVTELTQDHETGSKTTTQIVDAVRSKTKKAKKSKKNKKSRKSKK